MAGRVAALRAARDRLLRAARAVPAAGCSRRSARSSRSSAFLGPGLIAANAGNDAGGIATYSSVGAKYGYDLLWMMVVITVSLIVVQEMAARMGAVTGKGLAELIREQYGVRWSLFATTSVLIANLGICVSEFVGIGAALGLAGVPPQVSVPIAAVGVWLLLIRGSYKVAERIFVLMTIPFFAYPIAAILAQPDWGSVGHAVVAPNIHASHAYLFLFVATAGTTITPFMQLYVQSAVVERGVGVDELNAERAEVTSGSIFANLVASFIIIATGATLYLHGEHNISTAAQAAKALEPFAGRYAEVLFAVGLLGASLLAAAILPVTAAYVIAETFGFEKGISRRIHEAPVFVGGDHRADRDRDDRGGHPRDPGDQPAGGRPGGERRAPAGAAGLHLAARERPRADGRLPQRPRVQRRRGADGGGDVGALGAPARGHAGRSVSLESLA